MNLARRAVAEGVGTAMLLAVVVGMVTSMFVEETLAKRKASNV